MAVVKELVDQLTNYFPEGTFANFQVLHPRAFNVEKMKLRQYGTAEILALAQRFNLPDTNTVTEFQTFMFQLASLEDYDSRRAVTDPVMFWSTSLKDKALESFWGANWKALLRKVLVVPASSADAERTFSILKHIKSSRRTSLSDVVLNDLVRVSMHGPRDVRLLNSAKLAREWKGVAPKDPRKKPGPKRKASTEEGPAAKRLFTADGQEEIDAEQQVSAAADEEQDIYEVALQHEIDNSAIVEFGDDDEDNMQEPEPLGEHTIFV